MNTFNNLFLVEKSIFDSLLTNSFDIKVFLIILVTTGLLGLLMSICYLFIKRKSGYQPDFPISLIILPMVSSTIIYFVSDNIASGLTLGGIFALTRFRSEQKDTEDLSYIFSTMGIGLICGFGYVTVGIIFALVIITVMILLNVTKFAQPNKKSMRLKIIIPEEGFKEPTYEEPVVEDYFAQQAGGDDMDIDLTDEDKTYLRLKWGKAYKPEEWVKLE